MKLPNVPPLPKKIQASPVLLACTVVIFMALALAAMLGVVGQSALVYKAF